MADIKQKKSWYKRWWAIVLYVFIGLIILSNLFGQKGVSSNSNINTQSNMQINSQEQTNPKTEETKITTSRDFCRSIIPERINILCFNNTTNNEDNTPRTRCWADTSEATKYNSWNDGTPITRDIEFEQGWRTGENVKYLYTTNYLRYEKTPVGEDGTIGEKISYRVMLILDPNDQNAGGFKVKSYKCCQNTKYNPCDILGTAYKNW